MTNTMNYNANNFNQVAAAVMADVEKSDVEFETLEDMYKAACQYVQMTREEFAEKYRQIKELLEGLRKPEHSCELKEEELESVVGGNAVTDWFSSHAKSIGIALVVAVALTGVGAIASAGVATGVAALFAASTVSIGEVACMAAAGGAITAGIYGVAMGIESVCTNRYRNGFVEGVQSFFNE